MLISLSIKNYVLIESLTLEFSGGLNVFTGETGAGKSIIVDAAEYLLGEKIPATSIRDGSASCVITGVFSLPASSDRGDFDDPAATVKKMLDARGIEIEIAGIETPTAKTPASKTAVGKHPAEIIIRREQDVSGRNRCYINDTPVSAAFLKDLGARLVDIHGQHEHQILLDLSFQREFLDTYAAAEKELENYRAAYDTVRRLKERLGALELDLKEKERLTDLYRYQIKDIDSASLEPGDEERIKETLPQIKNASRTVAAASEIWDLLEENENSLAAVLAKLSKAVDKAVELGAPLQSSSENLAEIRARAAAVKEDAAAILDKTARFDEKQLDEMIGKLDKIDRFKKKYGATVEEILDYRDKTAAHLAALESGDETKKDIETDLAAAEKTLAAAAAKLTKKRNAAAAALVGKVEAELKDLNLPKAVFRVAVAPASEHRPHGADDIEFLFSANPGEKPRALKDIISGGEMSRFMLALKTVGARVTPVMIFDEIDAGLSGPVGQTVGVKLASLAASNQIIAITHLPQIAAFAGRHFFVEKRQTAGRTVTGVKALAAAESRDELARMLSGARITESALRHADELIQQAKNKNAPAVAPASRRGI